MALNVHVIECTVDPNVTPVFTGQHWINTTTGDMWFANGTASINNWIKTNIGDNKVKISSNDTTPNFLLSKLVAGTNITLTENNDGADETITINSTGGSSAVLDNLSAIQIRRTTSLVLTTSFVDITFDTTDVENNISVLEHDNVNTDRILVEETGLYLISYDLTVDSDVAGEVDLRVRTNDSIVISGSTRHITDSNDDDDLGTTFLVNLNAGDFLNLQIKMSAGTHTATPDINFVVVRLQGVKGDQGPVGSGSSIIVKDENTNVTNTPHTALDFIGTGVTVTDAGAGVATVNIPGGNSSIFGSEAQEASSDAESTTTSTIYQEKLKLTTPSLPSGKYRIGWSLELKEAGTGHTTAQIELDDTTIIGFTYHDSSFSDYCSFSGVFYTGTISGIHTIDIDFRAEPAPDDDTAKIRRARLEIWRIS